MKTKAPASESGRYSAPLRGSGSWKDVRSRELELGVGVRADFAVQIDLFVLRGYPFHGRVSLEMTSGRRQKDNMARGKMERACPMRGEEQTKAARIRA